MERDKITKAYILRIDQVDTIDTVAREHGNSSASAALRTIIDEWKTMRTNPACLNALAQVNC